MINDLQKQVNNLRNKLLLLESATNDLPIPMWLKDLDGTMLSLNKAYEWLFLLPNNLRAEDYIGKHDSDVWPEEVAEEFGKNDRTVISNKSVEKFYETVSIDGENKEFLIIKFPRKVGNTIVGIAGIAIDKNLNIK